MIVTITLNPAVDETLVVHELQLGETNRIKETDLDPGGKGLNVGRVINRLGKSAVVIALVGGETGQFIKRRLIREGVKIDFVGIKGATRVNISVLDESTGVQTNLNHEGPMIDTADLNGVETKIKKWLPETVLIVMGGSLPPGTPIDTYARLIRWMRENDLRVILDSSGKALKDGVKENPYLIKPNLHEMEELVGRKLPTDDDVLHAARELVEQGIGVVVVSMAAKGSVAVSKEGAWRAVPPVVSRESTLGAGDSLVGGLAIGISEHFSLADSLALGTAAATATVMTPGTELCRPEDVQRILPKVRVERIE